ncbi:MAG: response regulator transcription factor [Gammaproteobacteria bacterium]|uniref:response regulator transcription factor n=1 Tax=Pseudomonadaceae TaxID=135621 RepID=UPI000C896824|nr:MULTISPECIES: response regulator transcription factor [Pseudomonadaceae]MAY75392.1 DNA-binding response regulator [Phycisphaerae bacterium]MBU0811980.1 response regulator transcription factor [Gammaproteobacteria bacterium]MBK3849461.1 response regulator [Stutzerimonas xanthomarina]MBU0852581.1 response regulator transcription factor [Gammaproteobacteria bacterium]MBU1301105.1 response regulator transcription factor [Gammaproteobacteria bacterium]
MRKARLLLIDDHTLFRTGLKLMLAQLDCVGEIFEAGTVSDAITQHGQRMVDVILLDVNLPGINGLDGIAMLRLHLPAASLLVISGEAMPDESRLSGLDLQGYICKSAEPAEVERAVLACLPDGCASLPQSLPASVGCSDSGLTARQVEVLGLLCQGKSNKAIAYLLGLSENTVRVHVSAVLDQLQVSSRTEAVVEAQRRGIVRL